MKLKLVSYDVPVAISGHYFLSPLLTFSFTVASVFLAKKVIYFYAADADCLTTENQSDDQVRNVDTSGYEIYFVSLKYIFYLVNMSALFLHFNSMVVMTAKDGAHMINAGNAALKSHHLQYLRLTYH